MFDVLIVGVKDYQIIGHFDHKEKAEDWAKNNVGLKLWHVIRVEPPTVTETHTETKPA